MHRMQDRYGTRHGKTVPTPPAGCEFISRTRVGQHETNGTALAAGLLGADKYGQDQAGKTDPWCLFRAWPAAGAEDTRQAQPLAHLPRIPDTSVHFLNQIGAGAFGTVRSPIFLSVS